MINWFKGLPLWLQIVILVGIGFLVYQVYIFIKTKVQSGNYKAAIDQSQIALNQLANQGVKPSYGQAEYTTSANSLQQVLQGCTIQGASNAGWSIIEGVFSKMKNDADIYALIKAYGIRTTDRCGLFNGDLTADLSTTLTDHFSGSEQFFIKRSISDINDILKKNSIVFTF